MGQNLDERKKSAVYPYYHSPPHVNMIMISSTFQMVVTFLSELMSIEEFREICLVLSLFMDPPLICAIQAAFFK